MIAESFDQRTLANMEVALDRVECAERGDRTLIGLTEAGQAAASELCTAHGV
jgi:hypothetical protein